MTGCIKSHRQSLVYPTYNDTMMCVYAMKAGGSWRTDSCLKSQKAFACQTKPLTKVDCKLVVTQLQKTN